MAKMVKNMTVFLLLAVTLSACGLFRKKNGCHSCPSWSKLESLPEDHRAEEGK